MHDFDVFNECVTNQPTDQPTDSASYRGALSHLKMLPFDHQINQLCDPQSDPTNKQRVIDRRMDRWTDRQTVKVGCSVG